MPIFGPIASRRFGLSLGIDVVAGAKRECNFDCLYCELKSEKKVARTLTPEDPQKLISEVERKIASGERFDVITVTANGEPTIYDRLDELIDGLNRVKNGCKTLILSNGSTVCDEKIAKTLAKFDIVKLSLDSARAQSYKKLDRPIEFDLQSLIECMAEFRRRFGGELVLETLFVDGINDSDEDAAALAKAYNHIAPNRIDISTIDRPPAFAVKPISSDRLFELASKLEYPHIVVAVRKDSRPQNAHYGEKEWIATLEKRAFTMDDARFLADEQSFELFNKMASDGIFTKTNVAGVEFYRMRND